MCNTKAWNWSSFFLGNHLVPNPLFSLLITFQIYLAIVHLLSSLWKECFVHIQHCLPKLLLHYQLQAIPPQSSSTNGSFTTCIWKQNHTNNFNLTWVNEHCILKMAQSSRAVKKRVLISTAYLSNKIHRCDACCLVRPTLLSIAGTNGEQIVGIYEPLHVV